MMRVTKEGRGEVTSVIMPAKGLRLCALQDEHFPTLFQWRNEPDFMALCSTRRNRVTFDEFVAELHRDFQNDRSYQCLIARGNDYIGTLYCYNLNRTDGFTFFTIYMAAAYRRCGYGAEATALFLSYLFTEYHLYKIYAEAYSYNEGSLRALLSGGFVEEGRFRQHRLHNGKRHDLIRLAFFRKQLVRLNAFVTRLRQRTA